MSAPKRKRFTEQYYLEKLQLGPEYFKECMAYFYGRKDLRRIAEKVYRRHLKSNSQVLDWTDVFHESLDRLMISLIKGRFKGQGKLSSYFYRICFNYSNEFLRQTPIEIEALEDVIDDKKEDSEEDHHLLLRAVLAKQSGQCQKLFKLIFYENPPLDKEAIARELNMTNKRSVSTTISRCKKKLKVAIWSYPSLRDFYHKYL